MVMNIYRVTTVVEYGTEMNLEEAQAVYEMAAQDEYSVEEGAVLISIEVEQVTDR